MADEISPLPPGFKLDAAPVKSSGQISPPPPPPGFKIDGSRESLPARIGGAVKDAALWAITPFEKIQGGKEVMKERAGQVFGEVERRLLPEALTQAPEDPSPLRQAAHSVARSLVPLPSPAVAKGAIELGIPAAPLDLAAQLAAPALPALGRAAGRVAAERVGRALEPGLARELGDLALRPAAPEAAQAAGRAADLAADAAQVSPKAAAAAPSDAISSRLGIESAPTMRQAPPLPADPGPALTQAVKATDEVVQAFREKLPDLADPARVVAFQRGEKITEVILDAVERGQIAPEAGARLFGVELRPGEAAQALTQRIRHASSSFGQGLNRLSQAAREFEQFIGHRPDLRTALDDALKGASESATIGQRLLRPVAGASDRLIQTWRGLLVTQVGTAVRNAITQGVRAGVGVFDDALNGALRAATGAEAPRAAFSNAAEDVFAFLRRLQPAERLRLEQILNRFPTQKTLLEGSRLSDIALGGRIVKLLNTLNTVQEDFFRRAAFDARLRSNLSRLGFSIDDLPRLSSKAQRAIVDDSVSHALEMTFAAPPRAEAAKAVLKAYEAIPLLNVLANPFPRFWFNAMRFSTEFSPLGVLFTRSGARNPELAFRGLSRAMTGTMVYSAALAMRSSKFAGERWYEVRPDPDKAPGRVVDLRNFNPFASALFVADFLKRVSEVRAGARSDLGYSAADLSNALLALRRSDFAGIPLLDSFAFNKAELTSSSEAMIRGLERLAGDFFGGFTVPVRSVRDLIEGRSGSSVVRSTEEAPLLGPAIESIPGLREQLLPAAPSLTRSGARMREEVGRRQLEGLSIRTKTPVERELDRLGIREGEFRPMTGEPEADRLIAQRIGPAVEALAGEAIAAPGFTDLADDDRRELLRGILREIRADATRETRAARPDLDLKLKARRLPPQSRKAIRRELEPRDGGILSAIERRLGLHGQGKGATSQ